MLWHRQGRRLRDQEVQRSVKTRNRRSGNLFRKPALITPSKKKLFFFFSHQKNRKRRDKLTRKLKVNVTFLGWSCSHLRRRGKITIRDIIMSKCHLLCIFCIFLQHLETLRYSLREYYNEGTVRYNKLRWIHLDYSKRKMSNIFLTDDNVTWYANNAFGQQDVSVSIHTRDTTEPSCPNRKSILFLWIHLEACKHNWLSLINKFIPSPVAANCCLNSQKYRYIL